MSDQPSSENTPDSNSANSAADIATAPAGASNKLVVKLAAPAAIGLVLALVGLCMGSGATILVVSASWLALLVGLVLCMSWRGKQTGTVILRKDVLAVAMLLILADCALYVFAGDSSALIPINFAIELALPVAATGMLLAAITALCAKPGSVVRAYRIGLLITFVLAIVIGKLPGMLQFHVVFAIFAAIETGVLLASCLVLAKLTTAELTARAKELHPATK